MSNDPHMDDAIRQAYRAAAQTEPGPQLDARILQAAHAALESPKQTPARWSWLVLPFSAAAVAILVTTLVLQLRPTPSTQPLESAGAPPTSAMKPEVAATPKPEKKTPGPTAPASRASRQDQAAQIAGAEAALLEQRRKESEKMAAAPPLTRSVESAPRPAPSPVLPLEDADATALGASAAAEAEPRPAPEAKREALSTQAKDRSPEMPTDKQIEDIRKLQREGKLEAAKKALAELRKQFPHYKVPEDLRGLIEPASKENK